MSCCPVHVNDRFGELGVAAKLIGWDCKARRPRTLGINDGWRNVTVGLRETEPIASPAPRRGEADSGDEGRQVRAGTGAEFVRLPLNVSMQLGRRELPHPFQLQLRQAVPEGAHVLPT
jgi:hypothetical protein